MEHIALRMLSARHIYMLKMYPRDDGRAGLGGDLLEALAGELSDLVGMSARQQTRESVACLTRPDLAFFAGE